MRYTVLDEAIRRLAARQRWLFSRMQATNLGASERFIARRMADGTYEHPEQSVYALSGHPWTWPRKMHACVLGTPASAVGGLAAAALLGLNDFRPCHPALVVPPGTSSRGKTATIHRQVGFATTVVDGLPVTTVAQTLFDIAPLVGLWRLERAMDDALVGGKLTVEQLEERLRFYEGARRKGLPKLRPLIEERGTEGWTPPESELEAHLFAMLDRVPGLAVVRQPALPWRPHTKERVDCLLPVPAIVCEGDGRRWHTRVADFDRDRWRDNEAAAHGLRVMRFTWVHLTRFVDDCVELVDRAVRVRRASAA
ncbi:MAG: hypothetical protein QOE63_2028 [Acidimicrobiaceae bacterium]